jgi:hypothetical protein
MKVAFLVLNHRPPEQLIRLLTTLRSQLPDSPIVVHHDVFHGEFPAGQLEPIGNVHLLASGKRMTWGDFSLVEACCWSLAWMLEHLEFDWMVLLSGQDYPIKPLDGLVDDLTRDGADAVFGAAPINQLPAFRRMLMYRRYFFQYRPATALAAVRPPTWLPKAARDVVGWSTWGLIQALNNLQPLFKIYRLTDRIPYRFGRRARNTPFGGNWPCWHASQWFALSRDALGYVLDYLDDHPEYVDYYRGTMVPDESMLATLVYNSPNLNVANRDVTYTRWANNRSPHPDTFRVEDLGELAAVPQYFARKFDIDKDSRILDKLDNLLATSKVGF